MPSYHVCETGVRGGVNVAKTQFREDYQGETGGERLSNCALQGFVSFESFIQRLSVTIVIQPTSGGIKRTVGFALFY